MSIVRLFLNRSIEQNDLIQITDSDFHYLSKVMRKTEGDIVALFNGINGQWDCEVIAVEKKTLLLRAIKQTRLQESERKLTLFFAPIKNPDAAWIVTKATELGVTDIQPMLTTRSVVTKVNLDKLKLAAKEAAEQSERITIPNIHDIQPYAKAIESFDGEMIFLDESGRGESAKVALHGEFQNPCIIVGPEGGFTAEELNLVKSKKSCILITLGKRILRSETAIIAALSLYQGYLGDW